MSYAIPYEIILFMIIIALASVLIYLNYRKNKKQEPFEDIKIPTSYSLYTQNTSSDFDNKMKLYKDTLGDINSLMHVYGCGINIGTAPNALNLLVKSSTEGLYVVPFDMSTSNFSDVNIRIYNMIQKFYDENGRTTIQGQVYVVLSQAPFYRDENDNIVAIQYNANNYLNLPVNVMKTGATTTSNRIQFYGYMIFTAYTYDGKLIKDNRIRKIGVSNIKKNFRQKESLCFTTCPLHNDLPCGCASQDTPYQTNCLESGNSPTMSAGERYSYTMLYRINPRFSDLMGKGILANDYSDFDWYPEKINSITTRKEPNLPESEKLEIPYSGDPGIVMYQHCGFKGWKSELIPPGNYTMDQLSYYGVKEDVSTYKVFKNVKVRLYLNTNYDNPIPIDTIDGYITGNVPCFTKYNKLNDNLKAIEIIHENKDDDEEDSINTNNTNTNTNTNTSTNNTNTNTTTNNTNTNTNTTTNNTNTTTNNTNTNTNTGGAVSSIQTNVINNNTQATKNDTFQSLENVNNNKNEKPEDYHKEDNDDKKKDKKKDNKKDNKKDDKDKGEVICNKYFCSKR